MPQPTILHESQIEGAFRGFNRDVLFILRDGSKWIQAEYKYWYHYAYSPEAQILDIDGDTYLQIVGEPERVRVNPACNVIQSTINGTFSGWSGDSEYELDNGQVWKQASYKYEYKYAYRPDVVIYDTPSGTVMSVEETIAYVRRMR